MTDDAAHDPVDPIEARVRALVASSGIDGAHVVDCDPALADTADFCAAYGYERGNSANAIVVAGRSEAPTVAVCVVLATTRLDVNGVVRRRLGVRKASFASAEQTVALTGMVLGGVTPIGLPGGVPLWIDRRVMERPIVVVGGGSRACKVVTPPTLLAALAGAEVVDDLAIAIATP